MSAAFGFVVCVALTPSRQVWAFFAFWAVLVAVIRLARVPVRYVIVRLTVVAPFIAFAVLIPFVATGERIDFLGVRVSEEGVWSMWNIVGKAVTGATVSVLLTATTQIPDLLKALERLRAPRIFVSIASFMVRYMDLIADDLQRMRTAMTARGYRPRWLWQVRPLASAAAAAFIRSYERGERVHAAMLARGYLGVMPEVEGRRATRTEWATAGVLPLVGGMIVATAQVIT